MKDKFKYLKEKFMSDADKKSNIYNNLETMFKKSEGGGLYEFEIKILISKSKILIVHNRLMTFSEFTWSKIKIDSY